MKKNKGVIIIILIMALMLGLGYYATDVIEATKTKKDNSIILGLDLSGGVSITYKIVTENPTQTDINDTIEALLSGNNNEFDIREFWSNGAHDFQSIF